MDSMLRDSARTPDEYGVMLLSDPNDPTETTVLGNVIENDTRTETGKPWPWTMSQRYTSLEQLSGGASKTSHLE
jgi:hypothetical protein